MPNPTAPLRAAIEAARADFAREKRIMSFSEYVADLAAHPRRHLRGAAGYVRDCFDYWGARSGEERSGYKLFDAPFDGGRAPMIGQEPAQHRIYDLLDGFARAGRVDKMILLHGPNGSAKSTLVGAIMRAMEHYARTDDGALYRFSWVFPTTKAQGTGGIGFGDVSIAKERLETFAHLEDEAVDARLADPLSDHPLLLIPAAQRAPLLEAVVEPGADWAPPDFLERGELNHTNRAVFDALLASYQGDLEQVLKHVRVERFYISRRYRSGAVTVEPQMRVDAGVRQLTADRSLAALPPALQTVSLFAPSGDLVDANRGVVEFDDLFKRHPDLNKYLLAATERASVALEQITIALDLVFIATGNETYLDAYKQTPEYASFKGRVELVRLPYLLDYEREAAIYEAELGRARPGKVVAPHTAQVAALWAVLTRMRRPRPGDLFGALASAAKSLSPLEKADLYAHRIAPERLDAEQARALRAGAEELMREGSEGADYEGRFGASPREMRAVLASAAARRDFPELSPSAVLAELEELVRDASVFPFLQLKPDGDYFKPASFIEAVRERYLDRVDAEVLRALGMVEEGQYEELFRRYVDHVSQWLKGEKVLNKVTGRAEEPDESFMSETERSMDISYENERAQRAGRGELIQQIAAAFIDRPGEQLDYRRVFAPQLASMRRRFYAERSRQVARAMRALITYLQPGADALEPSEAAEASAAALRLTAEFGYTETGALEAVARLYTARYQAEE